VDAAVKPSLEMPGRAEAILILQILANFENR
jgi:hypothetical protein